jgi:hypothetical protein
MGTLKVVRSFVSDAAHSMRERAHAPDGVAKSRADARNPVDTMPNP